MSSGDEFGVRACPAPSATADANLYRLPNPEQRLRGKNGVKWAEFRQHLPLDSIAACFRLGNVARIVLDHELSPGKLRKTAAYRHQFLESSAFDHMSAIENQ